MLTFLILAGILALGIAAMRIAKPEYYSPKCCMGIAYRIVKDHEAAAECATENSAGGTCRAAEGAPGRATANAGEHTAR
ncbi:MAG: hypothetical protein LBC55_06780 [Desulfovibrio sp.]|jgi:hypothetical protein|nr:hypothetical protein [Desulfovibrio sp.]